jgi:hypothetical protein
VWHSSLLGREVMYRNMCRPAHHFVAPDSSFSPIIGFSSLTRQPILGGGKPWYIHQYEHWEGCVLAEASWLPNSSGLAYVTECAVAGNQLYRLSLYSVNLRARPRLLLRLISAEPDALDLSPGLRCVSCA